MSNPPIPTIPVPENVKQLREEFYKSIVAQSSLMDTVCERLLTLELAIPGLYATILKLISGEKATMTVNAALYITNGADLKISMQPRLKATAGE